MGRELKVDWEEIKTISTSIKSNASSISNIKNELNDTISDIKSSWQGTDASNFITNFETIVNELDDELSYLDSWCNFINKASIGYSDTFQNYLTGVNKLNNEMSSNI